MSERAPSIVTRGLLAVAIVFPLLATFAVIMRFYARKIKSQSLRADDWMIVFTLIVCWMLSISTMITAGVVGVDRTDMSPVAAANFTLKILWAGGVILCIVLTAVKISILLFYRRIFTTAKFKRCVDVMIVILLCWGIATMVAQILCGDPVSAAWDVVHIHFRFNYWDFALAVAGMGIVFDVIVLCFPIPIIVHLQMPTKRKMGVLAIFWLGAFCCVAAVIRFHALYESIQMEKYVTVTNYGKIATAQRFWQHIEPNTSIIAACLPTYGNLFAGKPAFFASLCNFFSPRSWSSFGNDRSSDGSPSNEKDLSPSASSKSDKSGGNWQILDNNSNNRSVEIPSQNISGEHGALVHDLEAGLDTKSHRIEITKEIDSGAREQKDDATSSPTSCATLINNLVHNSV